MESRAIDHRSELVRSALLRLCELDGGPEKVKPPRGYPHLSLAVIDSVYSLRARYGCAVKAVDSYCEHVPQLRPSGARFDPGIPEHDVRALLLVLDDRSEDELVTLLGGNRQLAPGTDVPKAVVVREVARALAHAGVGSRNDLERMWSSGYPESAVLGVAGIGQAAWRYILSLAGVERVKPDTMVTRWVQRVVGPSAVSPAEAARLLESAADSLSQTGLTVRGADHLVWRVESGRLETPS